MYFVLLIYLISVPVTLTLIQMTLIHKCEQDIPKTYLCTKNEFLRRGFQKLTAQTGQTDRLEMWNFFHG